MAHIGDVPEKTLACNHLLRCLQYAVTLHGSRWTSSNSKARMEGISQPQLRMGIGRSAVCIEGVLILIDSYFRRCFLCVNICTCS